MRGSIARRSAGARVRRWFGHCATRKSKKESGDFGSEDHAEWVRGASRVLGEDGLAGRGVERSCARWFGSADGGGHWDLRGRLRDRKHGSRNTGMAAGVKPRSREAVRHFPQGFTRDDSPGEDEGGGSLVGVVVRSHAALIAVRCRPVEGDGRCDGGILLRGLRVRRRCGRRREGAAAGDAGDRVPQRRSCFGLQGSNSNVCPRSFPISSPVVLP
jgi:hypothetical protein